MKLLATMLKGIWVSNASNRQDTAKEGITSKPKDSFHWQTNVQQNYQAYYDM